MRYPEAPAAHTRQAKAGVADCELIALARNGAAALAGDTVLRALIEARRAPRNHPGVHPSGGPARYHRRRASGESNA